MRQNEAPGQVRGDKEQVLWQPTLYGKIDENIQTQRGSSIYYVGCSTVPSLLLFFIIIIQPAEGGEQLKAMFGDSQIVI